MLEHLQGEKIKVGLLDFGDGRSFLKENLAPVNREFRERLTKHLEEEGFEVVSGDEVIWQNDIAVRNGKKLLASGVDRDPVQLFRLGVAAVFPGGCSVLPPAYRDVFQRQPPVPGLGGHAGQLGLSGPVRYPPSSRTSETSVTLQCVHA